MYLREYFYSLRVLTKSTRPINQEQAQFTCAVKRLIFVPFRLTALLTIAAQSPRRGLCHQTERVFLLSIRFHYEREGGLVNNFSQ